MTISIGLPSKGRLREATLERFAAAGFAVAEAKDSRAYRASIKTEPDI